MTTTRSINPDLDLILERILDITPEAVWQAWTQPEQLKMWFTPAPWKTVDCTLDLRPGGAFHTTMQSPEGQLFANVGCYLEVMTHRKLVWTSALLPGFRPLPKPTDGDDFLFTAMISIEPHDRGTHYTAIVMHGSAEDRSKHERMGFHEGWSKALDQLVEIARRE